ncbi:hypothetical protein GGX14DRAFT_368432 [Mycena pura]|uniref:DUF659 domain-containing protein n=1 Tax=Mycena pura TaxID=153505 RepID=A0AAD6VB90_9AGAR|nr:hypothetical protein GGX14DRAFT_368432 [Mycena pura]
MSAIAGDGGPNVRLAKRLISRAYIWILNIYDPCHNLDLFMKDIGAIFKPTTKGDLSVLAIVSGLSNYFGTSNYGTAQLDDARKAMNISTGVKSSSETRFSTCHIQAKSICTCMPAIKHCIETETIKFTSKATKKLVSYITGPNYYGFMQDLSAFISLTTAPANAILTLEGQHINCADVFYAWVCIAHSLQQHFENPLLGLGKYRAGVVTAYNARFNQMMSESSHHIFLLAYFLHPSALRMSRNGG